MQCACLCGIMMRLSIITILLFVVASACGGRTETTSDAGEQSAPAATASRPTFSGDSAMALVEAQCAMGPRVPGTAAHARCVDWLKTRLTQLADTVIEQLGPVETFDGVHLTAHNIIASFNAAAGGADNGRVLLIAHYDCRPWADADPDPSRRTQPVLGANDGASGTAVLLELARLMAHQRPGRGVDLLLVDVEDWGQSGAEDAEDTWALGTQYWVAHRHVPGYTPAYAILLDMVGARDATFMREQYSEVYATGIVDHVWRTAQSVGATHFVNRTGGGVTDDHVPLLRAGIAAIDIIDQRPGSEHGFFDGWHTTADTPDKIDPAVLAQVGSTLVALLY